MSDWTIIQAEGSGITGAMFIASGEGGAIGYIWIKARELPYGLDSIHRYAEIVSLEVDQDQRRQGIGTELIRRAMAWAKNEGFERVAVESSLKAVGFYQGFGFGWCAVILDREL